MRFAYSINIRCTSCRLRIADQRCHVLQFELRFRPLQGY